MSHFERARSDKDSDNFDQQSQVKSVCVKHTGLKNEGEKVGLSADSQPTRQKVQKSQFFKGLFLRNSKKNLGPVCNV